MIKEINAYEKFGGTRNQYLTMKIDGKMMLMSSSKPGKGKYLMLEDGSVVKIEKFGASKRMSYITHETLTQVFVNGEWSVVNKANIMSPIAQMVTDLPEFTIVGQAHVSFTKYDNNYDRNASIRKSFIDKYIK